MPTSETASPPEMLSRQQVADLLGVHYDTVRRWEDTGALTPVRTPGGRVRFHADEARKLADEIGRVA